MLKTFRGLASPLSCAVQRNFAVNEKQLKLRMKAVGSIKKITKAMKMVASSKMRADVARLVNGKDFGFGLMEKVFENDSYVRKKAEADAPRKALVIPITTDR